MPVWIYVPSNALVVVVVGGTTTTYTTCGAAVFLKQLMVSSVAQKVDWYIYQKGVCCLLVCSNLGSCFQRARKNNDEDIYDAYMYVSCPQSRDATPCQGKFGRVEDRGVATVTNLYHINQTESVQSSSHTSRPTVFSLGLCVLHLH